MAKAGSVAPKERVNITYRPATGDAKEEVELPLKLLVLGDFTMREDERQLEARETVNVDKSNFNEVLSSHDLKLETVVPDRLSEDPEAQMTVSLDFKTMRDFEPDAIIKKVPALAQLVELREALKALKGPLGNVPAFKKKIKDLIQDEGTRERLLKELGIKE